MSNKYLLHNSGLNSHISNLIEYLGVEGSEPIARQYVPDIEELNISIDEDSDPIGDNAHSHVKGIIHRYPDRVLLKVSNVCDVYCRYCFRREMIGPKSEHLSDSDFEGVIEYIKNHNKIWEVILTGGDPLVLSVRRLQRIFDELDKIDHVKVVRIHTRIPVSNPLKIIDTISSVFKSLNKSMYIVLHINNVKEITSDVEAIILRFRDNNCSVLSQSVLLKGVNDDAESLEKLFRKLVLLHVTPYYLHHLDRAKGTSHFRVSLEIGREIMKELQGRVSGICLPKYMLDIPGGHGKIPVHWNYINDMGDNKYSLEDYKGRAHIYNDGVKEE